LAAGAEIVCEKPLACSPVDLDRMIAAEQRARGRITPVYQYRFGNRVQKAKRIIDADIAGTPYIEPAASVLRKRHFRECAQRLRPATTRGKSCGAHDNAICARVRSRVERVFAARNAGSASSCA
jgi:predicted dehydrogenase